MAFILWLASHIFIVEGRDRVETVVVWVCSSWNKKASLFCLRIAGILFPPIEWGCGLMSTCKEYINIDVIYTVVSQGPSNVCMCTCVHIQTQC